MRKISRFLSRLAMICAILASQSAVSFAQTDAQPVASEMVHLQVGDIFEILPVHTLSNATYTWILTQNGSFLEASRASSYRKRLIQPGQYTLFAEIDAGDATARISRTFTLDYTARQPNEPIDTTTTATGSGLLVRTEPPADGSGRVILPNGTQLVHLMPINPNVVPLGLDTDLSRDADGDGIPNNDIEGGDTFFHSSATPVYVWLTDDPLTTHSLSVTAAAPDGAKTQIIQVINEDIGRAQGVVKSPVHISAEQTGARTYTFKAVFDNPAGSEGQLLYQWQFGDGQQSLVTQPSYTYASDGSYQVSLLIRNLRDGSDVASTTTSVNVSPNTAASASASSQMSSVASSAAPAAGGSTTSSFGIGSILLLILLFIGCMAIGVGIIFLIGKLRKGKTSLADRLESMEQTLVKSPTQEAAPLKIAPPPVVTVETKTKEPPASIAEREKEENVARPAPEPVVKAEATPPWLNPSATMKPGVAPAPAAPVQAPKPAAPAPSAPSAPSQTPSWLQPARAGTDGQPTTPVTPKPAPQPAPQKPIDTSTPTPTQQAPKPAAPAPVAAPKPAPQPAPQPAPTPSATPAWLQTPAPAAAPKPPVVAPSTPTPAPAAPVSATPKVEAPAKVEVEKPSVPPTPVTPAVPKTVVEQPKPAPQTQMPKAEDPVLPPKPATPTPAPVSAPQPQVQKPVDVPAPTAPAPQAPKPIAEQPAPKPNPVPPAPVPAPGAPIQPVTPVEPKPAPVQQMDIPPASDDQIAIIRAESLNPQDGQNG